MWRLSLGALIAVLQAPDLQLDTMTGFKHIGDWLEFYRIFIYLTWNNRFWLCVGMKRLQWC